MNAAELALRLEGQCQLVVLDSVVSTNDEVVRQALMLVRSEPGQLEGLAGQLPLAVIALQQTAGRGRLGRSWVSPCGGLYLSVMLGLGATAAAVAAAGAAAVVAPEKLASLSPLVALAVREALQGFTSQEIRIKWPNDLLTSHGKLAGILVELKPAGSIPGNWGSGEGEQLVVIGMGINVVKPDEGGFEAAAYLDEGAVAHAWALEDVAGAQPWALEDVAAAVIGALLCKVAAWRAAGGSFAGFAAEYEACLAELGQQVCVRNALGDVLAQGVVQGVDQDARLLLRDAAGATVAVAAGEVTLRQ